jgi:hypothetical protein
MIRVKAAFFSFTPPALPEDDGSYLRWHLLDHMVEQYQLPGIQYALRYIADGEYLERRIVATGNLEHVGNVVNYLVGDPVQQTPAWPRWVGSRRCVRRCSCACPRCCTGTRRRGR